MENEGKLTKQRRDAINHTMNSIFIVKDIKAYPRDLGLHMSFDSSMSSMIHTYAGDASWAQMYESQRSKYYSQLASLTQEQFDQWITNLPNMIKLTHELESHQVNPAWMFFAIVHSVRAIVFLATGKKMTIKWNNSLCSIESLSVSLIDPSSKQVVLSIDRVNHGFCNLSNTITKQSFLINLICQGNSFVHVPSTLMLALFKRDAYQTLLPVVSQIIVGLNHLLGNTKYTTYLRPTSASCVPFFLNRGELGSGQLIQCAIEIDARYDKIVCNMYRKRDVYWIHLDIYSLMDVCESSKVERDKPIVSFEVYLDVIESIVRIPSSDSLFTYPSLGIASIWCIDALTSVGRKGKELFDISSVFNGSMPVYFANLFEEQDTIIQVEPIVSTSGMYQVQDYLVQDEIYLTVDRKEDDSESDQLSEMGEPEFDWF